MSREDKEGFGLPKKPTKVTPSKEGEEIKTGYLAGNRFFSLSTETKYHTIQSYLSPERKTNFIEFKLVQ